MADVRVIALPMGEFTFTEHDPWPGQTGVVVAYAVRHTNGAFLFDTGFGFGNAELDEQYQVRARPLPDALGQAGIDMGEITAIANCHLHADHSGQNLLFPGVPIYVQPAEWAIAHAPEYTIVDWIDFPGADIRQVDGDHEPAPGIRVFATPGHSPGHQSLVVETEDGPLLLAGQAVYSHGEWAGIPGSRDGGEDLGPTGDRLAYRRSVERLRKLNPRRVLFGHDRQGWPD